MRILRVIASMSASSGGPAQGIRNSIPALQDLGCSNEVVCLDDPAQAKEQSDSFPVHALGGPRDSWARHRALRPWLRDHAHRFDAVILHGLWLYPSYAVWKEMGGKAEGGRRKAEEMLPSSKLPPYYVFPHGMLDPWFQKAPERRWKALRNWVYWKLIEHKVIRDAAGLLFTCEEELRLARTTFRPYEPKREINVGYGIAGPPGFHAGMKRAFEERCPGLQGRPYLLFLSRIHPKKGVDLLVRAYDEAVQRQKAESNVPDLVLAGPGLETAYGREMRQLVSSLKPQASGSPPTIHFPSMLTGDAKWGAFYGCEAFILPSHQENFGIAVVEALACGKPVLISDQINIWREIAEAGAGIVDADTEEGTGMMLEKWLALPGEERELMGSRAQACFGRYFGIEGAARRLMEALGAGSNARLHAHQS